MTSSRALARNSALNLLGQVVPLAAAVVAIPPLMRGLGAERFGLLTLGWAAIGYFSLFEMGLGRALTQAVAQRLSTDRQAEVAPLSRSAMILLTGFGIAGALLFAALTPVLVVNVLNVSEELHREAIVSFWILAASLPFVLATSGWRALLEAHQHFGVATLLRLPLVVSSFLGPLLLLPFTRSLIPAMAIVATGRVIVLALHSWAALRMYPFLRARTPLWWEPAKALLRFGGWMTVSNVVSPLMVSLDRFAIGSILTVAAVSHYVTPYEVVVKLLIIPVSVAGVLIPALAASIAHDPDRTATLYDRFVRALVLTTFPAVLLAVALAEEGLFLWAGPILPPDSAVVARWLGLGVFAAAVAQAPLSALQSAGRPDLVAKLHVAELPFYLASLLALASGMGLTGVAMAWTIRSVADAVLLFWMAHRWVRLPVVPRVGGAWPMLAVVAALAGAALLDDTRMRVAYVLVALGAFIPLGWMVLLSQQERDALRDWVRTPREPEAISIEEIV